MIVGRPDSESTGSFVVLLVLVMNFPHFTSPHYSDVHIGRSGSTSGLLAGIVDLPTYRTRCPLFACYKLHKRSSDKIYDSKAKSSSTISMYHTCQSGLQLFVSKEREGYLCSYIPPNAVIWTLRICSSNSYIHLPTIGTILYI